MLKDPIDYLTENNYVPPPEMHLNEISQGEFNNIVEQMEPKNSQDLNGVSAKIIKYLRYELATPLVQTWQTNSMRNETRDDDFYVCPLPVQNM